MNSLLPLGVDAETGALLPESIAPQALDRVDEDPEQMQAREVKTLGVAIDDPNDLLTAGWCVVFPGNRDTSALQDALKPLLDLRRSQAGALFAILDGDKGYLPGDTAQKWLGRRNLDFRMVDPEAGVPYYVLLVGSPDEISFEFQYGLDSYWAVGRLYFDDPAGYRSYASKAVAAEQTKSNRTVSLVATRHLADGATQAWHDFVAVPLATGTGASHPPLGSNRGFIQHNLLANDATKANILDLLAGKREGGLPALLFSGSHGVRFGMTDPSQTTKQGSLLCADFPRLGSPVTPDKYLAEMDLGDISLDGMIHVFFACYSAGCPATDTYDRLPDGTEKPLMAHPIVSKLPQGLLSRGALAVVGHVDRAWANSFEGAGRPHIQDFRFTLDLILQGVRVGHALDQFNQRWSVLSNELSDLLRKRQSPGQVEDDDLAEKWKARNDARNYVVLGDPAVRLVV